MRRVRSALVIVAGSLLAIGACTNDFDKFENADGRGVDPLAEQDASSTGDGATPANDGSRTDADSPLDAGGDACARAASCEATMTTCRSTCTQTQTTCLDACTNNGFSCRRACREAFEDCTSDCRSTCRSCASGCRNACD